MENNKWLLLKGTNLGKSWLVMQQKLADTGWDREEAKDALF
jgi:hypothetical protein